MATPLDAALDDLCGEIIEGADFNAAVKAIAAESDLREELLARKFWER